MKLGKVFINKGMLARKDMMEKLAPTINDTIKVFEKVVTSDGMLIIGTSPQFREMTDLDKQIPQYNGLIKDSVITTSGFVIEFKEITKDDKQPHH
jgi:hypothetical protein